MTIALVKYPKHEKPSNYFKIQKFILKIFGVSFDGYENNFYKTYAVIWLFTVFLTYTIIELYEVYVYFHDVDTLVNILSYLGTDILGVIKVSVLLYYSKEIGKMLEDLEKGVFYPNVERGGFREEKLVKNCILMCNRQTVLYYLTVISVVSLGSFGTMLKHLSTAASETEFPFMPFSWFDASSSPYYELIWFYQSYWRMAYAYMVSSTDSLIAGLLSHVSIQFKILRNAIRNVIKNAEREIDRNRIEGKENRWKVYEKHLRDICDYHDSIIKFAGDFERLFSILLLCVFLATLFILCFIMYHASLFNLISLRAAQDFSYVAVVTLQVFLYCYWGNELNIESLLIADACWEADFVGVDVRFQKALVVIMRRSQKAVVITAGKFSDLSLETYAWIIRASYSYYTLLRSSQKN